jgi:CBS domain-containing protein
MIPSTMVSEDLLVEDAIEPVDHRVRPQTPLSEVVELMVQEGLEAVPVVGEGGEVLGMVTAGDALGQIMQEAEADSTPSARSPRTARDVMTRTVLCVSEGEPLLEAAHMMVHKDVERIPVAREGALIGIVTRAKVLRALHLGNAARAARSGRAS